MSDLVREDGGVYTCTFKNTVGQVSHVIKLVIEGENILINYYYLIYLSFLACPWALNSSLFFQAVCLVHKEHEMHKCQ